MRLIWSNARRFVGKTSFGSKGLNKLSRDPRIKSGSNLRDLAETAFPIRIDPAAAVRCNLTQWTRCSSRRTRTRMSEQVQGAKSSP